MLKSLMTLPLLMGLVASAQQPPKPGRCSSQVSAYASRREALLAPGNKAMGKRDYAEALKDYRKVLAEYPRDGRVLMIAGNAAWAAGDLQGAAGDYRKCLEHPGDHPWGVRFNLLQINAALGQWNDFAQGRKAIEEAAIGGNPQVAQALKGFTLERFVIGSHLVDVIDYPDSEQAGDVRYRFNAGFEFHIDLIEPPGSTAQLVEAQYSEPHGQALIRSYPGGKPSYLEIRAEVLRLLETQFGTSSLNYVSPWPQPGCKDGSTFVQCQILPETGPASRPTTNSAPGAHRT